MHVCVCVYVCVCVCEREREREREREVEEELQCSMFFLSTGQCCSRKIDREVHVTAQRNLGQHHPEGNSSELNAVVTLLTHYITCTLTYVITYKRMYNSHHS